MIAIFQWIRTSVRNAVLGGFQDALAALNETEQVAAIQFTVTVAPAIEDKTSRRK